MWFLLNNDGVITNNKTVITMTDNKKEQERNELHRIIWAIADEMRGSVDGWDFKSYILGILFYRYISENITNYINRGEWESGNTGFDYADLKDSVAKSRRRRDNAPRIYARPFFAPKVLPAYMRGETD